VTPPDETLAWTDAQVEAAIVAVLPQGKEFACEWQDGLWVARVESQHDGAVTGVHEAVHIDRRMALYEVYAVLWLERQPRPSGPNMWDPNVPRPTRASVSQFIQSRQSDPEDLNPVEVAAVYGVCPSHQRRD